jgi:hypothetical protein
MPLSKTANYDVVLSQSQQVYSLEYRDNINVSPSLNLDCENFRSGPSHYRLCIGNAPDGWLHASLSPCPAHLVRQAKCTAKNEHWYTSHMFSTALKPSFLLATLAYDRLSGNILSHEIESEAIPANIPATELLSALRAILNTTIPETIGLSKSNPILGIPTQFFGRLIAAHMYRTSEIMEHNPEGRLRGVNALQSLLALTLYYCQNGVLGQTIFAGNKTEDGHYRPLTNYQVGPFAGKHPRNATVAHAETQYTIQVGRATLIAYIVLSSATLLICILVLVVGSLLELVHFDAEPTLWPVLDFWTQCRVEDSDGKVITAQDRVEMAWIYEGRELLKAVERLRVTRRKRKMRGNEQLELPTLDTG